MVKSARFGSVRSWVQVPLPRLTIPKKIKAKALVLFSGGLDSLLTCKILQKQKIDFTPVFLKLISLTQQRRKKLSKEIVCG